MPLRLPQVVTHGASGHGYLNGGPRRKPRRRQGGLHVGCLTLQIRTLKPGGPLAETRHCKSLQRLRVRYAAIEQTEALVSEELACMGCA